MLLTTKQLNQIHAQILKNHNPSTLNLLLKHLSNSCTPQNALVLYNQIVHHPTCHNHYSFTYVLRSCSLAHAHQKGLEVHAHVIKSGHLNDVYIQNSLLHFYVMKDDIFSAHQIFGSIEFPDVVSWTSLISGLSKCGFAEEAIKMFSLMHLEPNCKTLVAVLSACSVVKCLRLGKAVHGYSLRSFIEDNNVILGNAVLDFYVKCGCLLQGKYLFVKMPKRDVFSWTTMIGGLAKAGFCEDAVRVFQEMVKEGESKPNEATMVNVLSACSYIGALSLGQWLHSYLNSRHDVLRSELVGNALVNMYVKCGNVGLAVQAFKILEKKDVISWSTVISGLAMNGYGKQAMQLFSLMLVHGVHPDDVTFIGLLSACSHGGLIDQGLIFFKVMRNVYRIVPQMQHYACIVDMYGRAGLLDEAEAFIREMPVEADGPVWSALFNACKIHGNEKMFEVIRQGVAESRGVGIGSFSLLSNAYAFSDRWDDANRIRNEMRCTGLKKMAGCSWIEICG